MSVAFVTLYGGSEELILGGKTRMAIDQFIARNDLRRHPRLRWMTIEGPDGAKEELRRECPDPAIATIRHRKAHPDVARSGQPV